MWKPINFTFLRLFFMAIGLLGFDPDLAPKRIEGGSFFAGFLKTVVAVF